MKNSEAIGYMIIAAKKLGLSEDLIRKLGTAMYYAMDEYTEEEAEEEYRKT